MIDRRSKLIRRLDKLLREKNPSWEIELAYESPPSGITEESFDVAIPCFPLAKALRKAPPKIAEDIAASLKDEESLGIEKVEAVKGYVNLRFRAAALAEEAQLRLSEPLGASRVALEGEKIVVEFSSPNIAKPFGIGHLRSTNIGASVCRIYEALGAEVVKINHLGDWGTQFGKLITAYKHFGSADFVKGDAISNLYKLYVEFHEKEKEDPALLDEAREWFVKLENDDEEAKELWTWFKDVSYREFKKIYELLGVEFDFVTGESFYKDLMHDTEKRLEEKKLLKDSEGAVVIDLEAEDMPPCLIRKSDGSSLYATRDLAAAEYRMQTYEPSKIVYVVGSEQRLHFKQIKAVLNKMGYDWADRLVHVDFGLIRFGGSKMSTRRGNIILLEDVFNQAEQKALEIIDEKLKSRPGEREFSEDEKKVVARQVGLGAVIYFDLRAKRTKDVNFDWADILSFEGDTGPYLQYTHVRLQALLDKAEKEGFSLSSDAQVSLETEYERDLCRALMGFPAVVEAAARECEPSIIAHELIDLSGRFNSFYMNVKVLKGEALLIPGRLKLIGWTQSVIKKGLGLLGIEVPARM